MGFRLRHRARGFMNLLRGHFNESLQRPKPGCPSHRGLHQFGDHSTVPSNSHPLALFNRCQELSKLILCFGNAYVHICDSSYPLAISQPPRRQWRAPQSGLSSDRWHPPGPPPKASLLEGGTFIVRMVVAIRKLHRNSKPGKSDCPQPSHPYPANLRANSTLDRSSRS